MKMIRRTPAHRLALIARIIESVDDRCLAADGPVTPTLEEMTQEEMQAIYRLAKFSITRKIRCITEPEKKFWWRIK